MLNKKKFPISPDFAQKALLWAQTKDCFCYLNGNDCGYTYGSFPKILAVGARSQTTFENKTVNQDLKSIFCSGVSQFGFIGYDLFSSSKTTNSNLPKGYFFSPETIIRFITNQIIEIESFNSVEDIFESIQNSIPIEEFAASNVSFRALENKESYIQKVEKLKQHINRGDIYQINYCIEFEAIDSIINPINVYQKLNTQSPMPFSGLLKFDNQYIICASPERYLKRIDSSIISQPMKGTAPRDADSLIDEANKIALQNSPKERAENTMIVDLVRNDLSRFCKSGTVKVEKLHEIYSFHPVHQMVTTVTGILEEGFSSDIAIEQSFPMGSMTGAPKISAMELITEFENNPRSAFSGALGFVEPNGDFDFNVLIRSIFYDAEAQKLTYNVGSGITSASDSEKEYEECMLKASIIQKVLSNN